MPNQIGKNAVVIGAGMGGLAAAKALSGYFDQVTVLERDALPGQPEPRQGTPQARHGHALLAGGQAALGQLFPDFTRDLEHAGALRVRNGRDLWAERPGFDPFPVRDLGSDLFCLSRPLLEFVTRRRVEQQANVTLRPRCRVKELVASPDGIAVTAVHYEDAEGRASTLPSDLVLDASGRGALTLSLLERIGVPKPQETDIGIDMAYSSAIFEIPEDAPPWKGLVHLPLLADSRRGALILPIENKQWIVSLAEAHGETPPPGDIEGFLAFVKGFRTSTVYNAIKIAKRMGDIARFNFPSSVRRHFERLGRFPRGLVPAADAICRFNPAFGQGMTVAAQEACVLNRLLDERRGVPNPLDGLAQIFFADIQGLLDAPWGVAERDFVHPQTRGQRPADFEKRLQYEIALIRLAAEDPSVHKILADVNGLLKPPAVLREPQLADRVAQLMKPPA
jgi:2-polyprenyl-6-methoxyphenol hydroxylase-like FAD-dependent oxidoreductase